MMKKRRIFWSLLLVFISYGVMSQSKMVRKMLDPKILVVDSITLAQRKGAKFHAIGENEIRLGAPVVLWIRLKGTSQDALFLLEESNSMPIRTKWFRNLNYGYVPERASEEQAYVESMPHDLKALKTQLEKQKFFYLEVTSSITAKRTGKYLARLVFNDNKPVLHKNTPCEFKFEVKHGKGSK